MFDADTAKQIVTNVKKKWKLKKKVPESFEIIY
jgi:hypothetical protein